MDSRRDVKLPGPAHPSRQPPAGRQNASLGWVLSIAGLVMTCVSILGAGFGLYTWLSGRSAEKSVPPALDVSYYLAQTEIAGRELALRQTSTAMASPPPTLASPAAAIPMKTPTAPMPAAAAVPPPALEAAQGMPAVTSGLTGSQAMDEKRLYDDFSSDALGWPVFDDGLTILKYENEAYRFQITRPDYYDWAFLPVEFIPYELEFDVQGSPGLQDGNFGVFCQLQDEQNYYYVEIDLQGKTYVIGEVVNGKNTPLTQPDAAGQYWRSAEMLKGPPPASNRIAIGCYMSDITLSINNEFVDLIFVPQQFEKPGKAAFFVTTLNFTDQDGYTVWFDNLEVYQPVQ